MSQENIHIVERVLATLRYASPQEFTDALLAQLFTPEIEWLPVTQGSLADRYEGYDGMRQFFADFLGTWDQFDARVEGFRDEAEHVVTTLRVSGQSATGSLDESWSALWTIENHRVARMEGFASLSGAADALGLEE